MLRLVSVAFALTSLACVVPLQRADAATFDFATLAQTPGAQGGGEGFWANQITTAGDVYTVGGIGVVATASGATSGAASKAYLDAFSGGLPAGLGVCSTSGGCAGTDDDNVGRVRDASGTGVERLTLTFTTAVKWKPSGVNARGFFAHADADDDVRFWHLTDIGLCTAHVCF
jgi:hypothetical protein